MSKLEKKLDERTKADVQKDVTTLIGKFDKKAGTAVVHDKEAGQPRRITVTLENGKTITADCVDNWQEKLEKNINKFKDR